MKPTNKFIILAVMSILLLAGCSSGSGTEERMIRHTIFIGIDASASFVKSPYYEDSLKFISYYIYGHIHGLGGLKQPKALFVATIGGFLSNEPKSFRPMDDFESKSVEQIEQDLKGWIGPKETITDFDVFFEKVKELIQKRNLILAPVDIVILSDGEPAKFTKTGKVKDVPVKTIDITPLEYLARNITIRLLYASPVISDEWEKQIPRKRTRIWTADNGVMNGWKEKLKENAQPEEQMVLWKWVEDNVDFRVRYRPFQK